MSASVRESPIPQPQCQCQPPRPPTPQTQTPSPPTPNRQDEDEHTSLVAEIRRLEKSMNVALRASRDEMESLKDASAEKRAALKRMQEELDGITGVFPDNDGEQQHSLPPSRTSGQSTCSKKSCCGSRLKSSRSGPYSTVEDSQMTSIIRQNTFLRRVSATGDRPFFRRPPLRDDEAAAREDMSVRRRCSDSVQPSRLSFRRSTCADADDSHASIHSSNESKESRLSLNQHANGNFFDVTDSGPINIRLRDDGCSSSESEISQDDRESPDCNADEEDYQATLDSKKKELARLQKQHGSNENQLSYLASKLTSIQTQSRARWVQHNSTVDALNRKKHMLSKSVERRERLITQVERDLEQYEVRIGLLEQEIKRKSMVRISSADYEEESIKSPVANMEEQLRKYQLRLNIHSQYTAKAIESFLNVMSTAQKKDIDGILLNDSHQGETEIDQESKKELIEEIASEVDIELNNLERMIKEVGEKVKEYRLLSSMESSPENSDGRDFANFDDSVDRENVSNDQSNHPNQLLRLSEEYADILADFITTISKTMESTIQTMPQSFSIEFQQSPSANESDSTPNVTNVRNDTTPVATSIAKNYSHQDAEEEELTYFQMHRKKLHLLELQRSQLQFDTNISILENSIESVSILQKQENKVHDEVMRHLHGKLSTLIKRLEGGGIEMDGLMNQVEKWAE